MLLEMSITDHFEFISSSRLHLGMFRKTRFKLASSSVTLAKANVKLPEPS